MEQISSLDKLLTYNLRKLYSSELEQLVVLKTFAEKANSNSLKNGINFYVQTKAENIDRLKKCFHSMKLETSALKFYIISYLLENCQAILNHTHEKQVADAGLISTLQQINYFNIASYGTVASYAESLHIVDVFYWMHNSMVGEKVADERLSPISEAIISPVAELV